MIVEVIAVGTELLLGQIVNSNTAVMGAALAEHGLDAHYQQTVGDNVARIAASIRLAMGRADAILITGGIGPTQDDLTREAVCAATGLDMVYSESYAAELEAWWARRGREMPASNLRQAHHPAGAELLPNPRGTAPGLLLEHEGTLIFCVPGVPAEMEHLLAAEVMPRLTARSGGEAIVSRVLRTWGKPESEIAEALDDLYEGHVNPSIAFLASGGEIKIRITAKGVRPEDAQAAIAPVEEEVRSRLVDVLFGADDDIIEKVLFGLLRDRGWRIGTAESMTGGMVASRLTDLPGSSEFFRGGLVAYDPELKARLLGVSSTEHVVDADTAIEMADGARRLLEVDVAVAVTGSAGPDPLEKPAGTAVIAVATPEGTRARELKFSGDRERVRAYATTAALHLTRLALVGVWWPR